jgi:hypothetical protein
MSSENFASEYAEYLAYMENLYLECPYVRGNSFIGLTLLKQNNAPPRYIGFFIEEFLEEMRKLREAASAMMTPEEVETLMAEEYAKQAKAAAEYQKLQS